MADPFTDHLCDIVGAEHVLTGDDSCAFYSNDIFYTGPAARAVIQPGTVDELSQVVSAATQNKLAVIARGGGLSYTKGYMPRDENAVILDTRRLNQIIEVNQEDFVATVEAGCTWENLLNASRKVGLRPKHFGPSTGRVSTVGGSLSQNSMFFGSARHGTAAESVLGLEVVLADGTVLSTGTNGLEYGKPFYRYHGPDMSGLFLGDCGALGIKAAASLRLEQIPVDLAFGSYAFSSFQAMLDAACSVARAGSASECLGLMPVSFDGEPDPEVPPTLHLVVEGDAPGDAEPLLARLSEPFAATANEREAVIPRLIREDPFGFVQGLLDPHDRLQVWTHGIFPPSSVQEAYSEISAFLSAHQEQFRLYRISVNMSLAVAGQAIVLEPVFVWEDAIRPIHRLKLDRNQRTVDLPEGPTTGVTKVIMSIREELRDLLVGLGAAHMQIGKFYAYRDGLAETTFDTMKALKHALDPKRLMNPGALDL